MPFSQISALFYSKKLYIFPVSHGEGFSGIYSILFLVQKKSRGCKPVKELRSLNSHIVKEHFKMESLQMIPRIVQRLVFDRSGGCVLPHTYHFTLSKVLEICSRPAPLSIQLPALQANNFAQGFIQGIVGADCPVAEA